VTKAAATKLVEIRSDAVPSHSPIIGVAGWKNSGKTTLTCRLVEEFTRRGLRVATIKHAHHAFNIDDGPTDSARHRRAGAGQVAIVSAARVAVISELAGQPEPALAEIIARLTPCDLIIVEGYKRAGIPKIEARRAAQADKRPLAADDPWVVAIAADHDLADRGLPVFELDDIAGLADFIAAAVLNAKGRI
jgi:molybdopterin-guanine dinucleotide biosynthesis adapter protein